MFRDRDGESRTEMIEHVPASGSCVRCGRALGLASAQVGGLWYGNAICALGGECPLDDHAPAVPEQSLYPRPRRFMRRRKPKELRAAALVESAETARDPQ